MTSFLKKIKNKFSKNKTCPNCGTELSKEAKICPECGRKLIEKENSFFKVYNLNQNCCISALIVLVFVLWLAWKVPSLQYLFLAVVLAALILLIVIFLIFGGLLHNLKRAFRF